MFKRKNTFDKSGNYFTFINDTNTFNNPALQM